MHGGVIRRTVPAHPIVATLARAMTARPIHRVLVSLLIPAILVAAPTLAHAQIEARCPSGWDSPPAPQGSEGEHVVVACIRGPLQIVVTQIDRASAPNGPEQRGTPP